MPVNQDVVGKEYPPTTYEIGAEKIREYARAIGEKNPVHHDRAAAQEAGFRDLVAPPMFVVVYAAEASGKPMFDPEIGMNFAKLVHGAQAFEWAEPVCAGDTITTAIKLSSATEKGGMEFYEIEHESTNQDGATVSTGTWTVIIRG